ncbi:DUF3486 family protein [Rhizobium sp. CRIBSB]|nr:DUF3486 family protein [Rhizobium sp. CRIBSB]
MARERPSSIDILPEPIRAEIGRLRLQGRTIDEILNHLKQLDVEVSRSALGRHLKGLATLRERMRHSREMATALVSQFGDQPDNQLARLNLELMHGVIMQTITAAGEDEDGEQKPVTFCPEDARFLADAMAKLAQAEKTNVDRTLKLKAEAQKEALATVEKVSKAEGLSKDTIEAFRAALRGAAA